MELITRACYCTREAVKAALDLSETARTNAQIDRGIADASDNIDGGMHRRFYPIDMTRYFDWPSFQYAYPWRIWFDQYDLVQATTVTAGNGTISIPLANLNFEPANKEPDEPYTYMEINRSTNSAYGGGATPQRDVAITGTWGYTGQTAAAGTLAAAVSSTSVTSATVSDSSQAGVGDLIIVDSERMLVQDKVFIDTTVSYTGGTTASMTDTVIAVADGTKFGTGEVIQLDSERCLIYDITGDNLLVKRAWDGTILAAHTPGTIFAPRQFTVARGQYGTTAATHLINAAVSRHVPPSLIRGLALAEALNLILGEQSGWARDVGEGDNQRLAGGAGLAGKWAQAVRRYGRKARTAAI